MGKRVVHGSFYIPSLDGIRAIAVLTVFIGHGATVGGPWPGHVGVTIFFFLSGYLITTLLRREFQKTGSISLTKFYLRRALRILPPAYLAIAVSVVLGATGVLAATTNVWGVLAEVFNYTNYYIVYVGRDGLPPSTTQFWSLAVEEHFYLIIPIVLLILFRRRLAPKVIGYIFLGAAALAPVWRIINGLLGEGFDRLYVSTDMRFDGLLIGSAMALIMNPMMGDRFIGGEKAERFTVRILAPIAVAVFIVSALIPSPYIRLSVADTVQCACLVPIFWTIITRPDNAAGRFLNSPIVMRLGVLSFSIYLFHRMALSIIGPLVPSAPLGDLLALIASILVAQIVYWCVEQPAARLRRRLESSVPVSGRSGSGVATT